MKNSWLSYDEYRIDKLFKNQPILTNGRKHTLSTRLISRFFSYAITGLALVILAGCATQTSSYGPKVSVAANEQIVTDWFEAWAAATFESDPVGKNANPKFVRAPNGSVQDSRLFWNAGNRKIQLIQRS